MTVDCMAGCLRWVAALDKQGWTAKHTWTDRPGITWSEGRVYCFSLRRGRGAVPPVTDCASRRRAPPDAAGSRSLRESARS